MTPEFKQLIIDGGNLIEAGKGDELTLEQNIAAVIYSLELGGFDPSKGLAQLDDAQLNSFIDVAVSQRLMVAAMTLLNESLSRAAASVEHPLTVDQIDQMLAETLAKDPSKIPPDGTDGTVH